MSKTNVSKPIRSKAARYFEVNKDVSLGNEDILGGSEPEANSPSPESMPAPAPVHLEVKPAPTEEPVKKGEGEADTSSEATASTRGRKPRNKVEEFHFCVENTRKFAVGGSPSSIWLDSKTRARAEMIETALGAKGDKKTIRLAMAVGISYLWDNHSEEIKRLCAEAEAKKKQNSE